MLMPYLTTVMPVKVFLGRSRQAETFVMLQKVDKMREGHIYPISVLQPGSLHGQLPADGHAGG